jgi:hypothetical protein
MSTTPISHCQLHDPKQLSEMTGIDLRIVEAFLATMEGGPNDPPVEPTLEGLWSFYDWGCRYDDQPDEEAILAERLELHLLAEEARFHARLRDQEEM